MLLKFLSTVGGAIVFYTCIPLPQSWPLEFAGIARIAPIIGIFIGGILGAIDAGLCVLGMPDPARSALIVTFWIGITGGLHLDGAMDTADGLATQDKERQLEVMSDSATGAFGAIAVAVILLLKTTAFLSLSTRHISIPIAVAGWARWGQLWAIFRYPYLKPTGKGAFHKKDVQSYTDILPSFSVLWTIAGIEIVLNPQMYIELLALTVGWMAIAIGTAHWFHRQLGGHTGDTYGAVVEWTETLGLIWATFFLHYR
ncbi:adenosylcobinamide-GDP ribazoletransferase [Roseofilum casamattae]|uniref:Adenosylcobinamide-GDP ribazoletransferase n=1 Tax=Roseofilum casamattae BLCC-M143 TaxID=3022442 RepID=A0ABT7BWN8_9CYAN|nr:adenosylcobinamide-GDP ribazoletransferase [Roseofilum casamattae]MDJ1183617.1 adenosylcobinamide-GDP ribazoletransferase [Roseofilum casamattae BLCC-M143]